MIANLNYIKLFLNKTITEKTSGLLTVGTRYRITVKGSGNFSNVGATFNVLNETFIATGTTPTAWTGATLQVISDEDMIIESLIPAVESHVRAICKNNFVNKEFYVSDGATFTDGNVSGMIAINNVDKLKLGKFNDILIVDSYYNDGYFSVDSFTASSIATNFLDEVYNETSPCTIYRVDYPKQIKPIFCKMINWQLNNQTNYSGGTVKAESIGKYSVSYERISIIYTPQIMEELQISGSKNSGKVVFL